MPNFSENSLAQLATCHPLLQEILNEAITTVDFKILEGHRGEAAQHEAFLKGTSKLDWPDGKHNRLPSIAVDVAPGYMDRTWQIDWKDVPAFARLMGHLERIAHQKGIKVRLGMDWDMDWRTSGYDPDSKFLDAPHIELVLGDT